MAMVLGCKYDQHGKAGLSFTQRSRKVVIQISRNITP
jgi:hypothetical protein